MSVPGKLYKANELLDQQIGSELPNSFSSNSSTPPIDWAADLDVFVPDTDASGTIALAQATVTAVGVTGTTIELGTTPTVGNMLVLTVAERATNGTDIPVPTGWTSHPDGATHDSGGLGSSMRSFYRVCDGSETWPLAVAGAPSGSSLRITLSEIENVASLDTAASNGSATTNPVQTGSVTPTAGAQVIIFGAAGIRTSDSGSKSVAPDAGWTEVADFTASGSSGNYPLHWVAYQVVASASGSYNPEGDCSTTTDPYAGQTLVFGQVASDLLISEGNSATDGDLSTYAGPSTDFYIRLDEAKVIVRTVLQLAWNASGSKTVTIYGANEADLSDQVQLDQWTVTATGSWSIDATSAAWDNAVAYEYFHLTVSVTARLHEWELYEADLDASIDAAIATHEAAADPHPGYLTQAEADLLYYTVTKGGGGTPHPLGNLGAAATVDLTNGNYQHGTLTANCTFTFAAVASGAERSFTLRLTEDGTGGWSPTWPGSVVWAGGTPTHTTTAGTTSFYVFHTIDGGTTWYGFPVGGSTATDWAEAADIANVGTTAAAGSSTETPRGDHVHALSASTVDGLGFVGPILISDTPSTPLVFADLLQNEAQDDLIYADP